MLLILDDSIERLTAFKLIIPKLSANIELKTWLNAPSMMAEVDDYLSQAQLISLDHDLYKQVDSEPDPGSGRDVADYLASCIPVCPIIIHSTNIDAAWGMYNVLSFAGWQVEVLPHTGLMEWYEKSWLSTAKKCLS